MLDRFSLSRRVEALVPTKLWGDRFGVAAFCRLPPAVCLRLCLTAAQHSHYNVLEGEHIVDHWQIDSGW